MTPSSRPADFSAKVATNDTGTAVSAAILRRSLTTSAEFNWRFILVARQQQYRAIERSYVARCIPGNLNQRWATTGLKMTVHAVHVGHMQDALQNMGNGS